MQRLSGSSHEAAEASTLIAHSSTELSTSVTEQASTMQEMVATIDEISGMVPKPRRDCRGDDAESYRYWAALFQCLGGGSPRRRVRERLCGRGRGGGTAGPDERSGRAGEAT